jgi:hypothetical protein
MEHDEYAHDDHRYEPKCHKAAGETPDGEGGKSCGAEERLIRNDLTVELPGLRRVVVCVEASSVVRVETAGKGEDKAIDPSGKE